MTQERDVTEGAMRDRDASTDAMRERDLTDEMPRDREVTGGTTPEGDLVGATTSEQGVTDAVGREGDVTHEPHWRPTQMETDDAGPGTDRPKSPEMTSGIRGGGGATWNKGSMEFDEQETIPPSRMKESEEGPWGTADQGERAERQHRTGD